MWMAQDAAIHQYDKGGNICNCRSIVLSGANIVLSSAKCKFLGHKFQILTLCTHTSLEKCNDLKKKSGKMFGD